MWKDIPLALIQPVYIVVENEMDVIAFCRTKEEALSILDTFTPDGQVPELTVYEVKLVKKVRFQEGDVVDITYQWKEVK